MKSIGFIIRNPKIKLFPQRQHVIGERAFMLNKCRLKGNGCLIALDKICFFSVMMEMQSLALTLQSGALRLAGFLTTEGRNPQVPL